MRFVRSATCTSGEPVSVSWVRYCATMSDLADSNSVTFTRPPNDSIHSLFSYKRRRIPQERPGVRIQESGDREDSNPPPRLLPPGSSRLQNDFRPDQRDSAVPHRV